MAGLLTGGFDIYVPLIAIHGEAPVSDTPQRGAIPLSELKANVGSAHAYRFQIQGALDLLFGAY